MKESISKKQLREFGLLIGMAVPIIIGWGIPAIGGHMFRFWTLWIGIPFLFFGLIKPFLLYHPYRLWMSLGNSLGWINSRIILCLIYFMVLIPIAFIMKFFGYDPLKQNKSKMEKISFKESKKNSKIDLTRLF